MAAVEVLNPSVRKDVQVRILPPPPWSFCETGPEERKREVVGRAYSFLLGMYLGDGHIVHAKKSFRLQIYLHVAQGELIERVVATIKTLLPERPIAIINHGRNAVAVSVYFAGWPWLFPQHGAGRKHTRRIILESWQEHVVGEFPEDFIRGCIESDGCRHRRIVKGRDYPAYGFCNRSEDILGLFTAACDIAGVRWRRSSDIRISIARRADVAKLDGLFGFGAAPGARNAPSG